MRVAETTRPEGRMKFVIGTTPAQEAEERKRLEQEREREIKRVQSFQ